MSQHGSRFVPLGWLAALVALTLLLACGENGAPEEGAAPGAAAEAGAAEASGSGGMSAAQAVERQIELWEDLVAELEQIHDEDGARAAVPRLSSISAEGDRVVQSIDPSAPTAQGSPDQVQRLEAVRDRYVQELTRITQEVPAAVSIISDALSSGSQQP